MKVGIVGFGFVGQAMKALFQNAVIYDPLKPETSGTREDLNCCDVAFVCVPTNMMPDGSCDTSIVEDIMRWLETPLIIIRSTIAPGTTDSLKTRYPKKRIVFQPEYVGETTAHPLLDESARTFLIFGGDPEDCDFAVRIYQRVYNSRVHIRIMRPIEAEVVKYMENSFIGTKVLFMNEFAGIAKAFGANVNVVREGFLDDPRMSRDFTFVYEHNPGFDGKCLPKDLNAIVQASTNAGYNPEFIRAVLQNNDRIRTQKGNSKAPANNELDRELATTFTVE